MVRIAVRGGAIDGLYFYPKPVQDRAIAIGLTDRKTMNRKRKNAFKGSRLSISWCDNMDSWLKYHAAFILPIVYLCYKTDCDLKKSTKEERKLLLDSVADAYHLLMALGYPVRPVGDEEFLKPGLYNAMVKLVIYWMSRTRIGALCTTEHCRHAPGEMEGLDRAFQKFRAEKPDVPMPHFDRLYSEMPSWEKNRVTYGR